MILKRTMMIIFWLIIILAIYQQITIIRLQDEIKTHVETINILLEDLEICNGVLEQYDSFHEEAASAIIAMKNYINKGGEKIETN